MSDAPPPSSIELEMLRHFVAGRDVPCPGCGYNVRDLQHELCPECGQRLVLSVRLGEPRQAGLIAGLVGLSAGAGLGGLLLIYAAIVTFAMNRGNVGLDRFILINAVGFLLHAGGLSLWIWRWGRIRRLSPAVRRILVLICCAMPLAFVVIFAATLR